MSWLGCPFGFLSFGDLVVPLAGGASESNTISPTWASAGWRFNPNGSIDNFGEWFSSGLWFYGGSDQVGADYEIRATRTSGTAPSGSALDTWLSLSAERSWTMVSSVVNWSKSCTLTIEIRRAGIPTVLTSGTYTIFVLMEA